MQAQTQVRKTPASPAKTSLPFPARLIYRPGFSPLWSNASTAMNSAAGRRTSGGCSRRKPGKNGRTRTRARLGPYRRLQCLRQSPCRRQRRPLVPQSRSPTIRALVSTRAALSRCTANTLLSCAAGGFSRSTWIAISSSQWRPYGAASGVVGLPVRGAGQGAYRQLWDEPAGMLYLRNNSLNLAPVGSLAPRPAPAWARTMVAALPAPIGMATPGQFFCTTSSLR